MLTKFAGVRYVSKSFALCSLLLVAGTAARAREDFTFGEQRMEWSGPCLSDDSRREVLAMLERNQRQLLVEKRLRVDAPAVVSFGWPLRPKTGFTDPGYHAVANFVDHNTLAPDAVRDYNCGSRTYDLPTGYNHAGTDYFLSPFPWNKMDNDEIQVVAAAAGTIIGKSDGNFDRSCDFSGSEWNAVYVQHADGSSAWYGHLKNGSLTTKRVGQAVAQGEFLGLVGSSGNSPVPHLHFEVRDASSRLIDPYSGSCNSLNSTTWWNAQRPYHDRGLNKISTHSSPVAFGTCPNPDVTHIQTTFAPGSRIYFYLFGRDGVMGDTYHLEIRRPDGSVWDGWDRAFDFAPHWPAYYLSWFRTIPANEPQGKWTFRVSYNGTQYVHEFHVSPPTGVEQPEAPVENYLAQNHPNPFNPTTIIEYALASPEEVTISIYGVSGKLVRTLVEAMKPAGWYSVEWDGRDQRGNPVVSGVYLSRMTAGPFVETKKLVLLK